MIGRERTQTMSWESINTVDRGNLGVRETVRSDRARKGEGN
jgi:hypothetical protein